MKSNALLIVIIFLSVFTHLSLPFYFSPTQLYYKSKNDAYRVHRIIRTRIQNPNLEWQKSQSVLSMVANKEELSKQAITRLVDAIDASTWYGKGFKFFVTAVSSDSSSSQTLFVKNIVSILFKFSVLFIVGSYMATRQEKYEMKRFQQEVERDRECRENMYFEAVEKTLSKLSDSQINTSLRKELEKQLVDLDPDGKIRLFLEGKSPRPVVKSSSSSSSEVNASLSTIPNMFHIISEWIKSVFKKRPNAALVREDFAAIGAEIVSTLEELDEKLSGVIDSAERISLMKYLMNRFKSIDDDAKRQSSLTKLKHKLDDLSYWVELSKRI